MTPLHLHPVDPDTITLPTDVVGRGLTLTALGALVALACLAPGGRPPGPGGASTRPRHLARQRRRVLWSAGGFAARSSTCTPTSPTTCRSPGSRRQQGSAPRISRARSGWPLASRRTATLRVDLDALL